jgi:chitodextrinase
MHKISNKKPASVNLRDTLSSATKVVLLSSLAIVAIVGVLLIKNTSHANAACQPTGTTYGTDTVAASVANGNVPYRVWVQMQTPVSTSNSILLELDGGTCYTMGGNSIPLSTWTWVSYPAGTAAPTLAAGGHSVKLIGIQPGVLINNVLLLGDTSCVPTGSGSNCTTGQADTTKPTVALTAPINNATVTGTASITANATDDTAMGNVQFQLDGTNLGSPVTSTSSSYTYSWNSAAIPNGTHKLTAIATDKAGNATTSSAVTVTTSNVAPPATVQNVVWNASTKAVSWTAYPGASSYVVAQVHDPTGTRAPTDYSSHVTTTSCTVGPTCGLPVPGPSETVNYGIRPLDANGNDLPGVGWSPEITVTWPPSSDTTAPTVTLTAPANAATVSGTVALSASASDNVGVSKVEFYVSGVLLSTLSNSPYSANWNAGAVKNGTVTIQAKAYDAAGNIGASSLVNITVNNPDTSPPTTPGGVTAKANSSSQVAVSWTASTDNVGVAKYLVERQGAVVGSVTGTSYTDNNLSASTTYTYNIVAVDAASNASPASANATVTTPAATVPDTTPPPAPQSLTALAVSPNQINLRWQASSDPSGIKGYNVYRGGVKVNSSPITATTYGDSALTASTVYNYKVTAVDGANNESTQSSQATATTLASATNVQIGYTGVGVSKSGFSSDHKRASAYSIGQSVRVSKVYVYLQPSSTSGQQVMKGVIYADSNKALLAASYEKTFHSTDKAGWYPMTLTKPVTLAPGKYGIGILTGGSSYVANFRYNSVSNIRAFSNNSYSSGPSNPFGKYTLDFYQMSLYASNQ